MPRPRRDRVMNQTRKVCDWCKGVRKDVVGLYALTNGRGPKPVAGLELCGLHERELLRLFRVRGRVETRERVPRAVGGNHQDRVLAWLKTQKGPQSRREVVQAIKLDTVAVANALVRLRVAKQVKRVGRGRAARWQIS